MRSTVSPVFLTHYGCVRSTGVGRGIVVRWGVGYRSWLQPCSSGYVFECGVYLLEYVKHALSFVLLNTLAMATLI